MTKQEKEQKIVDYINGCDAEEQVALHNAYCDAARYPDDIIYTMEDLNEVLYGLEPEEIIRMTCYGDFNSANDFWAFDGYGNLTSYTAHELPIYPSDIAEFILTKNASLEDKNIEKILKEDEKE